MPADQSARTPRRETRNTAGMSAVSKREKPPADWELVLKRNPVERLKREKAPLGIRDELPALIAAGYESVAEEDVVRLQWWGLYHDKPKIGTFMLRVKVPAGKLSPEGAARDRRDLEPLRHAATASSRLARTSSSTGSSSAKLPDVFAHLEAAGTTTAGGCGDTVRNITGCPVQGLAADELFDCNAGRRRGRRPVLRQPRLGEPAPEAQVLDRRLRRPLQRARDQLHLADRDDQRRPRGLRRASSAAGSPRCRGSRGTWACSSRREEANEILGAITSVWSEDLRYRVSRVKARLKFMVDDIGADGLRERSRPGSAGSSRTTRCPRSRSSRRTTWASIRRSRTASRTSASPSTSVSISGDQMIAIAELADRFGGDVRLTRQQNFIVTGVPNESIPEAIAELDRIGFPLDINPVRGNSIACTGEPHCNFSVAETKTRLGRLIDGLEERFGEQIADLRLHLDGCPHACAQHWVGDLGFQGTTSRDEGGVRRQAYDIFVRGSLGPEPADRQVALPPRADGRARRSRRGTRRGLARAARARRDLHRVLTPRERRRAGRAGRPRAGERTCPGGGGGGRMTQYGVVRRARGGRALDPVRGRGAADGARVGDRRVRARASRSRPRSRSTASS